MPKPKTKKPNEYIRSDRSLKTIHRVPAYTKKELQFSQSSTTAPSSGLLVAYKPNKNRIAVCFLIAGSKSR